ncbi:MAG: hypothetical protein OEZ01_11820, partial [Candidatus Heimdallarchaeota archaeon]|nr:hypothetical protein [Candidatus Heimdallarchaeota archaeon]
MSDVSIQMRRVTDKVEQFFRLFGFSTSTFSSATRTQVKARKRLGTEDIECVIAETSRGTSVGFYSVNVFQGLVYIIPFLFLVLMHLFALSDTIRPFLDGTRENSKLSINWLVLVTGEATLSFKFVTFILLIGILPFLTDYYIQKIRLNNLKSRFSFYSKEAMWETSEIPYSIATLQASRSIISHTWFLTVFYFGVFAFQGETQLEIYKIFQTSSENLKSAITDVFTFTIGFILGLISAEKSLLLRKDLSKFDARSRFSGSIFERRFDSILFGVQSSLITSSLFLLFLSVTFLPSATFVQASQFLLMAIIGGVVAGLIYQEGPSWVYTSYAIAIIFSTILFIFKTGTQSGYAFIINVQLFFIPIPFILLGSRYYSEYLKKYNIENHEWLYDVFPLMSLLSVYQSTKRRKEVKIAYEKT